MNGQWNEEAQLRYERERKSAKEKEILKMRDDAQKKYDEHEYNYQFTGSGSTYRTMRRYENIIEVCNLALQALNNECPHCESHKRTVKSCMEKYRNAKEFNMADVLTFDNVIADFQYCMFY